MSLLDVDPEPESDAEYARRHAGAQLVAEILDLVRQSLTKKGP